MGSVPLRLSPLPIGDTTEATMVAMVATGEDTDITASAPPRERPRPTPRLTLPSSTTPTPTLTSTRPPTPSHNIVVGSSRQLYVTPDVLNRLPIPIDEANA